MLVVEDLSVHWGATPLFEKVNFVVNSRDRIALVGKNGVGKSTLLKIICGLNNPDKGRVSTTQDVTIGYLPQVMQIADNTTVINETRKAFKEHLKLKNRIDLLNRKLQEYSDFESPEYLALVEQFSHDHERYLLYGGDNFQAEMERTLIGLGFKAEDFERPTSEFSGGWRIRIELAKILLQAPDLLLLDEPTNHLDIESISWLEKFIMRSSGAVILVSHDKAFVNNVTNRTLEITCNSITDYKVKYDEYLKLRAERREQQLKAYENQQKEIADIQKFIERFRYKSNKAAQVQSRIKQLEKIVHIKVDREDNNHIHLKFAPCVRSGDYPVICQDLAKSYDQKCILHDINLTIKRGEKVAFVGKNGEGKSTLIKCIMDEIPFDGQLKIGHQVNIGYFAQNQAQLLDENLTIYDTIDHIATGEIRLKINDLLGAFGFGGEISEKKVKVLSGGERSRLAMIKLLLEPVNMLILDEPTNHLDIPSKDVFKEAISAFDGTAIIVSHDREFLDGLVDRIYEFKNGQIYEYMGGIYDFLKDKEQAINGIPDDTVLIDNKNKSLKNKEEKEPTAAKAAYLNNKEKQKQIRKIEKEICSVESKIEKLETQIKEFNELLNIPEKASDINFIRQYSEVQQEIKNQENKWTELTEKLMDIS